LQNYHCSLTISVLEKGKYRIESFNLNKVVNYEVVERIENDLSKQEITYEIINDQQYLLQKGQKIRPIELGHTHTHKGAADYGAKPLVRDAPSIKNKWF
jgi:hypothetical protein